MKTKLLLLLLTVSAIATAQTFSWDGTNVNLSNCNSGSANGQLCVVTETVTGVTCVFSAEKNGENTRVIFGPFGQGTVGNGVSNADDEATVIITFSSPVDITTIKAFTDAGSGSFEFVPITATNGNSTILNVSTNASTQTLNWTGVTRLEISPELSGANRVIRLDDIAFSQCVVNIPNVNFKAALVANANVNTNGNTEIECAEASAYTGDILVQNENISDLTGLESFVNLTTLNVSDNSISTIDVSSLGSLTDLRLANNNVSTLDVSNNLQLEYLRCTGNQLTTLDVSSNLSLNTLLCDLNQITSLDLSNNPGPFSNIRANDNDLIFLDLANGNNSNISDVFVINNPNLTCINIDTGYTPTSNWFKDATASYSDNCAPLSVNDLENDVFKMYPNPTSSVLNIDSETDIKSIAIFSSTGKKVLISTLKTIDISQLSQGLYFVNIADENGFSITKKFIKE